MSSFQFARLLIVLSILYPVILSCEDGNSDSGTLILSDKTRFLQRYPIIFSTEYTSNGSSANLEYIWDFGDSTGASGKSITHSYALPGEYLVELSILDGSVIKSENMSIEVETSLELVSSHDVDVDSPSGLSFGSDMLSLWTVSDKPNGRIYQMDLEGNRLDRLSYSGDDLEGVSFDSRDSSLWIIEEELREFLHIARDGDLIGSEIIPGVSGGSGPEGIVLDLMHSRIFILKEKDPGALVTLDLESQTHTYQRINFAPDYSGLDYSPQSDKLWIVSHEASTVYQTSTSGTLITAYGIDMIQPEGLVFNEIDSVIYIIDDTTERLHKYRFWDEY